MTYPPEFEDVWALVRWKAGKRRCFELLAAETRYGQRTWAEIELVFKRFRLGEWNTTDRRYLRRPDRWLEEGGLDDEPKHIHDVPLEVLAEHDALTPEEAGRWEAEQEKARLHEEWRRATRKEMGLE